MRRFRNNETLVAMNISKADILVFSLYSPLKGNRILLGRVFPRNGAENKDRAEISYVKKTPKNM